MSPPHPPPSTKIEWFPERTSSGVCVKYPWLLPKHRTYLGKRREGRVFLQAPDAEWRTALACSGWHRGQQKVWKGTRHLIIWVKFQRASVLTRVKRWTLNQVWIITNLNSKSKLWPNFNSAIFSKSQEQGLLSIPVISREMFCVYSNTRRSGRIYSHSKRPFHSSWLSRTRFGLSWLGFM